ncbi:MAG: GNAT family N-acetyltransferase [Stenomitos rutilans HA7619-LM2]|jgi:ribosomal protein S18 acetylase RimI-like enzyme|nr:GNAT family N-acetyltransferase [Stenomitos rutilans HA7619-LM2]
MDTAQFSITRLTIDQWEKARASIMLFWDTTPSHETIAKFLSNPQNILLSAEVGEVLAGQAIAYMLERWDRDEPMLFLYSIDVEEAYRHQGIGTALIKAARSLGQAESCSEAFVFTNESNLAAKQLYQSTGGKRSSPDDIVMFEYD